MTAMLKLEEAIARWSASGAKDGGERSCSIISLKGGQAGQCPTKNSKESKWGSRKSFDEFRSPADKWSMIKTQQLPLQREPIKTR
jgi:hypothetical protein